MYSDEQLRLRADEVCDRMELVKEACELAVRGAGELVENCRKLREATKGHLSASAERISLSRAALGRRNG